jgi:hypothetical protein
MSTPQVRGICYDQISHSVGLIPGAHCLFAALRDLSPDKCSGQCGHLPGCALFGNSALDCLDDLIQERNQ